MSEFEEVGREPGIAQIVDEFYARVLDDGMLAPWFSHIDLESLKEHQRAFLAVALGGPEEYEGRSMRVAHAGLAITPTAFDRTVAHLTDAFAHFEVSEATVAVVRKRLAGMRAAIIQRT